MELHGIGTIIVADNDTPLLLINLAEKGLSLCPDNGGVRAIRYSQAQTAHRTYLTAIKTGLGLRNISGLARLHDIGNQQGRLHSNFSVRSRGKLRQPSSKYCNA